MRGRAHLHEPLALPAALLMLLLLLLLPFRTANAFAVVGYLPEWRLEGANYATLSRYLTHLLLFSLEPTPDGGITALDRFPGADVMNEIHAAKAAAGGDAAQVLVCFGGNGRSDGFSAMSRTPAARRRFVTALVELW